MGQLRAFFMCICYNLPGMTCAQDILKRCLGGSVDRALSEGVLHAFLCTSGSRSSREQDTSLAFPEPTASQEIELQAGGRRGQQCSRTLRGWRGVPEAVCMRRAGKQPGRGSCGRDVSLCPGAQWALAVKVPQAETQVCSQFGDREALFILSSRQKGCVVNVLGKGRGTGR